MDRHVRTIMEKVMRRGAPLGDVIAAAFRDGTLNMNPFLNVDSAPLLGERLLPAEELDYYVAAFERTGYRGGINWYRNIDGNAQAHPDIGVKPLDIPCLMLMADLDPALRPEFAADMPERCSNLEMHLIKNAGHWVQQEQPTEFNAHLVDWLRRNFLSTIQVVSPQL